MDKRMHGRNVPFLPKADNLSPSRKFTCLTRREPEEMSQSHTMSLLSKCLMLTFQCNFGKPSRDDVKISS